jgi:hypothetical protein
MTLLLFFAWYYIIRKHFKIENISTRRDCQVVKAITVKGLRATAFLRLEPPTRWHDDFRALLRVAQDECG